MSLSAYPISSAAISAQADATTGGKSNPPPKRIIIAASDPVVLPEAR
ncbi:hypothetical protein [Sphingomonas flavescens]|jgi:hypothetical protein|nr:hypothetical protein [Sphingomonas limnosediminicola]